MNKNRETEILSAGSLARRGIASIAHILGMEDTVRVQDPDIFATQGKNPRWFIRPFVDSFDRDGNPCKRQERIYLGRVSEVGKRQAITKKNEILARINKSQVVLQAQLKFGVLLDYYLDNHVRRPGKLSIATQTNYERLIESWIRPAWGEKQLCDMTNTLDIERWLVNLGNPRVVSVVKYSLTTEKVKAGMAQHTRADLRNLMSGVFTQARRWKLWNAENPMQFVDAGKKEIVRPRQKLTIEESRKLLESLPADVRQLCEMALHCGLRISEVLGLQWKHIDFVTGWAEIRQRFYRGNLDCPKTRGSVREVALGEIAMKLANRYPGAGHEDEFVFSVRTHEGHYVKAKYTRDDRDINQHFLRPAAKKLGVYYIGFGFHAFRAEAATAHAQSMGGMQTQRMLGHAHVDMTLH